MLTPLLQSPLTFIPESGPFSGVGDFTVDGTLNIALNILMGTSFSLGLAAIILSGIQFMMAQGNAKALDTARRYFTAAIIAIIISVSALTIKVIILTTLGADTSAEKGGGFTK